MIYFDSSIGIVLAVLAGFFVLILLALILSKSTSSDRYKESSKDIGKIGEDDVEDMLTEMQERFGGHIIRDIILPVSKGTTQIDFIYLCKKGVYVIEVKNYSGRIYGDMDGYKWTQVLADGSVKNTFYNPYKQNKTHVHAVEKISGDKDLEVTPLVIFIRANLSNVFCHDVYSLSQARNCIINDVDFFADDYINWLYKRLKKYKDNPIISEEEHIQSIKNRYDD